MEVAVESLGSQNIETPHETRPFRDHGQMEVITLGDFTLGRGTFEPGWRWSQNVKPIAGTDSCQTYHLGYVLSGRMKVAMSEGNEKEVGGGDVIVIPPGHDAEVIGDEPCQTLEFGQASNYA